MRILIGKKLHGRPLYTGSEQEVGNQIVIQAIVPFSSIQALNSLLPRRIPRKFKDVHFRCILNLTRQWSEWPSSCFLIPNRCLQQCRRYLEGIDKFPEPGTGCTSRLRCHEHTLKLVYWTNLATRLPLDHRADGGIVPKSLTQWPDCGRDVVGKFLLVHWRLHWLSVSSPFRT